MRKHDGSSIGKFSILYWKVYFFGTPFMVNEIDSESTTKGYLYKDEMYITSQF